MYIALESSLKSPRYFIEGVKIAAEGGSNVPTGKGVLIAHS